MNPYMDGSSGKRLLIAAIVLGLLVLLTSIQEVTL